VGFRKTNLCKNLVELRRVARCERRLEGSGFEGKKGHRSGEEVRLRLKCSLHGKEGGGSVKGFAQCLGLGFVLFLGLRTASQKMRWVTDGVVGLGYRARCGPRPQHSSRSQAQEAGGSFRRRDTLDGKRAGVCGSLRLFRNCQ